MNETALFSWIRATVPDESLQANAQADYRVDEEQHLAALRRIAAGDLQVLSPLKWHPREVLELTRNGTIASTDASARQRHQRRLFACLALLYAATELANDGHTISFSGELIACVDSIEAAFSDKRPQLLAFLDAFEHELRQRPRRSIRRSAPSSPSRASCS